MLRHDSQSLGGKYEVQATPRPWGGRGSPPILRPMLPCRQSGVGGSRSVGLAASGNRNDKKEMYLEHGVSLHNTAGRACG